MYRCLLAGILQETGVEERYTVTRFSYPDGMWMPINLFPRNYRRPKLERTNRMTQPIRRKLITWNSDRATLQEINAVANQWYDVVGTNDNRQLQEWLNQCAANSMLLVDHSQKKESAAVLEQVREQFPKVVRIAMTCYADVSLIIRGLHNGTIQKVIQKPIDRNELLAAIVPFEHQAAAMASRQAQQGV